MAKVTKSMKAARAMATATTRAMVTAVRVIATAMKTREQRQKKE